MSPRGGKRKGAGRPRKAPGEATRRLTVHLGVPDDVNELEALMAEGKAASLGDAVRYLIAQSRKRRARRAGP